MISEHAGGAHLLIPAASAPDVAALAGALAKRLGGDVRTGAGSPVDPAEVGRSLREATYALQVCRLEGWPHAGFEDLGTYRLLLSMTDPDALRAFADAMLAPLDAYDAGQGGDLIASLQAFLQHNARWETAAAQLFVHRHTLRYRMRKVEELTGRDLEQQLRPDGVLAGPARAGPHERHRTATPERPSYPLSGPYSPGHPHGPSGKWPVRARTGHTGSPTASPGGSRSFVRGGGAWPTATRCSSTASG